MHFLYDFLQISAGIYQKIMKTKKTSRSNCKRLHMWPAHAQKNSQCQARFSDPDEGSELFTIIPASCFIASVTWEIEEKLQATIADQPHHSPCPLDHLLIPAPLHSNVLQRGCASQLSQYVL